MNLTAAGIIPPNTCAAFPQTIWGSRSSGSSFVSTTKDIAIENHTISNCGKITIIKNTDPRGLDQNFDYTSNLNEDANAGGVAGVAANGNFQLNDNDQADPSQNTVSEDDLFAGTYTVTEGADPAGFAFESLNCTGGTTTTVGKLGTINLAAGDDVTCTYVNNQTQGALTILKNSTKGGAVARAGAVFSYGGASNVTDNGTGDEDNTIGTVCVSGLATSGNPYTVNETTPPDGYGPASGTEADQTLNVVAGTNCTDNEPGAGATFTNPPLADIQMRFRDGGSGETALAGNPTDADPKVITCDNTTGTGDDDDTADWDDTHTVTGVEAGSSIITVTCTARIDP